MSRSRVFAGVLSVIVCLAAAVASAQPPADVYDTSKPVTLKGTLRLWNLGRPHTYLVVDTKDASGKAEQWTVEIGSTVDLIKAGMDVGPRGTMKANEAIEITVLLPKAGATVPEIPEDVRPAVIDILKAGKRAYGTEALFSKDGKKYQIGGGQAQ